MTTERIDIPGHGGHLLAAHLDRPDGTHRATALFAPCFTCGKDFAAARRIARQLAHRGIATLSLDFTGLGQSQGDFARTSFSSNVEDLLAAARHLSQMRLGPDLLVGHSLGGAAILKAAPRIPSARAVATLAAPFEPGHVTENFGDALDTIARTGDALVELGGHRIRIGQGFVEDVRAAGLAPQIRDLGRALLVLHAPQDEVVGIENANRIFAEAMHPKSFVTLNDADHLLSDPEDARYAADLIATWSARYL